MSRFRKLIPVLYHHELQLSSKLSCHFIMPTDITEKGLETLIMRHLTGGDGIATEGPPFAHDSPDGIAAQKAGGSGWHIGSPDTFDRAHCIDVAQLFAFLRATQPDTLAKLNIGNYADSKNIARQKFLARISAEIGKRGVIDVLRRGISDGPLRFEMFWHKRTLCG